MRELLCDIETRKILLWFSTRAPGERDRKHPFDRAPTFISEAMVNEVAKYADEVVEVVTPEQTTTEAGLDRVFFADEEHAALLHPGASQHELAAKTLLDPLKALVRKRVSA